MRSLFFCLLLLAGHAAAKPVLLASIEPLALVLQELYGEQVRVETLMLPQQTPHQVAFTPAQARQVQSADLLVWLGAEAEPALAGLLRHRSAPVLALAELDGVQLIHATGGHEEHGDAASGAHLDPHLWLSPANMRQLAQVLTDATPPLADQRSASFIDALDEVERHLVELLRPLANASWLSAHDPWRYFHDHFALAAPMVVSPAGQSGTGARRFTRLAEAMRTDDVGCAIAEPEAGRALLQRLCQAPQCQVVALDPLARDRSYTGYTEFLSHVGYTFARCLRGPVKAPD